MPATEFAGPPAGVAPTSDPRFTPPVDVEPLWFARIDDAVRSLRAAVAVAIVLALAAAGIAVWALVKANRANDRTAAAGALNSRVAALEQRVSRLNQGPTQAQLARYATTTDVSSLHQQLNRTQADVAKLSTNSTATSTSLAQLSQRVDRLSQQVAALQAKQGSNSTATNGTSTTP